MKNSKILFLLIVIISLIILIIFSILLGTSEQGTFGPRTAIEDASISNMNNFTQTEILKIYDWNKGDSPRESLAYLKFNMTGFEKSDLKQKIDIKEAKIYLKGEDVHSDIYKRFLVFIGYCGSNMDWNESNMTWDNKPNCKAKSNQYFVIADNASKQDIYEFDITSALNNISDLKSTDTYELIRNTFSKPDPLNITFQIFIPESVLPPGNNNMNLIYFSSKENKNNNEIFPFIVVTYTKSPQYTTIQIPTILISLLIGMLSGFLAKHFTNNNRS